PEALFSQAPPTDRAEFYRCLGERMGLGLDRIGIVALSGPLKVGHRLLDRAPIAFADLRAILGERLLGGVDQRLGLVLRLDLGLAFLVLFGMRFHILDHALDVSLRCGSSTGLERYGAQIEIGPQSLVTPPLG